MPTGQPGATSGNHYGPRWQRPWRRLKRQFRRWPDLEGLEADGLELGRGVFVGQGAFLDPNFCWLISIGDDTTLSIDVMVLVHDASTRRHLGYSRLAPVSIGRRCFIGARAVVLPGVTIGDDAVVGAGSVVRRDVGPGTIVAGAPAKELGELDAYVARHRERMATRRRYPREGWTVKGGITAERKAIMRAELADGRDAYVQ